MAAKNHSKSMRIYIRKEKAKIRHSNTDTEVQKKLIGELQDRFH